ncbi:MAG: PaaI family thioesterase [Quinella sp. 3Q1]|nr:PaaI family thioesterase [Quinella sp. 3Q1]
MSDKYCFACGENNPIGLHLTFDFDGERIFTKKILPREFEGYEGTVHGGIISTMLDETMCKFIEAKYHEKSVTGRLEIRFKFPTPTEQELKITAWQENQRKNIISMRSTIETADGTITAEAAAKFAVVNAS